MSTAIQDIYPLTPTQQGILFHSLSSPGDGLYVVQISFTLCGDLDSAAEDRAWHRLVERHDVLRTAFAWEKQRTPLQVVGHVATVDLHRRNLAGKTKEEQGREIDAYLTEDRKTGFDLRRAPLFRVMRFALGASRQRVVITFHHIILDGWSIPLLLNDWWMLYAGAELQPPTPFRDHLIWLKNQSGPASAAFWSAELAGLEAATPLPLPPPVMDVRAGRGEALLILPEELGARLRALAKAHRLTMGSLVHGLWAILLSRYSGEDDVLYGLTRAGRPAERPQSDAQVGMFINSLPVRARVDQERPLLHWLLDLQARQQRQHPHEHAALVDVQAASSIPQGTPFLKSVVVYENYPMDTALRGSAAGFSVEDVDILEQTSFPFSLFAVLRDSLEIRTLYDRSLFEAAAVDRLTGHLRTLFEALADDPHQRIADLPLLTVDEERHMLRAAPPVPLSPGGVSPRIAAQAATSPEATAVIADEAVLDYAGLDRAANRLARHLLEAGAIKGSTIGLCLSRGTDMPVALLATLRLGCNYLPLDPAYPVDRLAYYLEDSGAGMVICHNATAALCDGFGIRMINVDAERAAVDSRIDTPLAIKVEPQDTAYVIYTSGSTGKPKGVRVSHRALDNLLASFTERLAAGPAMRLLAVTTLSFDIATLEMLLPLTTGGAVILPGDHAVRDPSQLTRIIEKQQITHMQATPSTWRLLIAADWKGRENLTALCGGEALEASLARALLERCAGLWNVYGPTETTIWSTALKLTSDMVSGETVPLGQPIDNTRLYVLDRRRRLVPAGIPGELYIAGDGLADGYHERPELTAERFIDDPFSEPDTGGKQPLMYRTGDLVRYRPDGNFDYLGRIDQQVKLRGHRLEIGEIEAVLSGHPAVGQAIVVVEGDGSQARLAAHIQPAEDEFPGEAELRRHCSRFLPAIMVPAAFYATECLPLTLNGKIDRNALAARRTPVRAVAATEAAVRALGEPAATLADIWRQILRVGEIAPQDNFFELGGHSLLIVPVQDAIRQRLGVGLDMVDLFRFPTLQTLAEHVANTLSGAVNDAGVQRMEARTEARITGRDRLRQRLQQNRKQVTSDA